MIGITREEQDLGVDQRQKRRYKEQFISEGGLFKHVVCTATFPQLAAWAQPRSFMWVLDSTLLRKYTKQTQILVGYPYSLVRPLRLPDQQE